MAATKPYNPVQKIEGMFNGCVMRIAQAIKDPANYGESTKLVIQECAKQFQDALDDCEIQILDAKWYLEHQLALNKAKREAKAREESVAVTKRKHDQIEEKDDQKGREEDVKRIKLDVPKQEEVAGKSPEPKKEAVTPEPPKPQPSPVPPKAETPKKVEEKPKNPVQLTKKPPEPAKPQPPPIKMPDKPGEIVVEEPSQAMTDLFQSTPQITPAATNDEFYFTSMFGEPSQDQHAVETNDDMPFDLDMGDGFGDMSGMDGSNQPNQADLDSLLPGLESYANQTEGETTNNAASAFDLPDLGAPNEFDAFLSGDVDFGGGGMAGGDMVLGDDPTNLEEPDFDAMFGDG